MQQPTYDRLQELLAPMIRQLDRQEERLRDVATRADLADLRKDLVRHDTLIAQKEDLQRQITRLEEDRRADKRVFEEELTAVRGEMVSKQDRFWLRIGQAIAILAFILSFFEFIAHLRIIP
jgi:hypothetical protein